MYKWLEPSLENLLEQRSNLHHALLIQGIAGIGLPELAHAFAAALLCEKPVAAAAKAQRACGQCASCLLIAAQNHPDLLRLAPESEDDEKAEGAAEKAAPLSSQIKVEAARTLIGALSVTSHRNVRRVVVIDPADALNPVAANTLLKTLEEPPPNVVFLLLSSRPGTLLPTIRSRCRVFVVDADAARQQGETWLAEQGVREPARWLGAANGAPLAAQTLAAQFEEMAIADRVKSWIGGSLSQRLATAQGLKRPDLKAWMHWWYRFIADCARVAGGGQAQVFVAEGSSIARLVAGTPHREWLRYLDKVQASLRAADHPLSVGLVSDSLLVQYDAMVATERSGQRPSN
jgi:DNA polymerase III subunit delta'